MERLLVRGGRVMDPASGYDAEADVAVADGRIVAIGPRLDARPADCVLDAVGCFVVPGLIDPHVHARQPGQEHKATIASVSEAAVAGGFTAVVCMPNTSPALDSPELIAFVRERSRGAACRVFAAGAATRGRRGETVAEIGLMAQAGAVAFTDDGQCVADAGVMARVLAAVAATGRVFLQHAQEPALTRGAQMHAGEVSVRLGLAGWPRLAEELVVERDVRLNRGIGCRYHVQHVSSAGTVEIIRQARARGEPVSGEATPHHLTLTHQACEGYDTMAKVNPPLREASDMQALRQGVADGVITVLATDHAPHTADDKALPFEQAPFGIAGLESALPLYAEALVHSGAVPWWRLIALLTIEPARLCGLDSLGLGQLRVGGPADITVIDPERQWRLPAEDRTGRRRNSPFIGRSLRGRAVATIVGGRVAFTLESRS